MASRECVRRLPLVVILGCTGTGKSKLAIEIGKRIGGEIVSADSMQVYTGLPIITNQVTKQELLQCPHHVINFLSPLKEFSVVQFRDMALPLIEDIKKRGKVPIVVGGTNYYIESLLWDILIDNSNDDDDDVDDDDVVKSGIKRRKVIEEDNVSNNDEEQQTLHQRLAQVDPDMASKLHPNDTRKIARSLQIYEQHGVTHSKLITKQKSKEGGSDFGGPLQFDLTCVFWLQCEKDTLNQRLDNRVDEMIENGLVKELIQFHSNYNRERINDSRVKYTEGIFQSIGFKEFHEFLVNRSSKDTSYEIKEDEETVFNRCVESMKTVTRRYAKKQTKWVKNRFLGRPKGSAPDVYGLDASELNEWHNNVLKKALEILDCITNNKMPNCEPLARNITDPSEAHSRHICEACNNRLIIGDKAWAKHIASKCHKWHVKKAKTLDT